MDLASSHVHLQSGHDQGSAPAPGPRRGPDRARDVGRQAGAAGPVGDRRPRQRTGDGAVKPTTPISPPPLIGRERERAWVRATLQQPSVRLLTLTGPGGVGKTRLARVLTAELAHQFPDGAYFVSLAELGDPTLVLPAIAHAIGLRDDDASPIVKHLSAQLGS